VPCQCGNDESKAEGFGDLLTEAWRFSDKVLDHLFCDLVIDVSVMHGLRTGKFAVAMFFATFDTSIRSAPVHSLLGDAFVYLGTPAWLNNPKCSLEGCREIARRFMSDGYEYSGINFQEENVPWTKDPCVYHWHKMNGGICYKEKVDWGRNIVVSACCLIVIRRGADKFGD